jgi:YHS domain-containing protein
MSEHVWCHGPSCHTQHTLDRVRGSKGYKVLRTRKIKFYGSSRGMYSYFCSNTCYNEFANKYVEQVIAIAPRNEPLETPIENPERTKHTTNWGYTYYDTKIREREV